MIHVALSKKLRPSGLAGILILAVNGCASAPISPPTATSEVSTPSPTTEISKPATTMPTAAPVATSKSSALMNAGAVQSATVIDVTTSDNFQAKVTITWHEIQPLEMATIKAAYPSCSTIELPASAGQRKIRGMVVEGTAIFPTVNSVPWPDSKTLAVSAPSSYPVYGSCNDGVKTSKSDAAHIGASPTNPSFSYVLYELGAVNPKFPQGDFKGEGYELVIGDSVDSCAIDGVPNVFPGCEVSPK